jgi:hypothetical protein
MWSLMIYTPQTILLRGSNREERDGRGMQRVWGRGIEVFWWGGLRERDNLKDPDVVGRIILRWIFRKWEGGMDWMELAQDRDRWRALLNANELSGSIKCGEFLDWPRTS